MTRLYPSDNTVRPDKDFIASTEAKVRAETHRLEIELKGYKNNLIKESIRMATEELGIHQYATGNFSDANKTFSKMREYCTTQTHLAYMHLRVALVSMAQGNWLNVQSSLSRIQAQPTFADYPKIAPAMEPFFGLSALVSAEYATAADHFVSTRAEFAQPMEPVAGGVVLNRAVLSANDCGTYGALTALATYDRGDIKDKLLDSDATFRQFLELEPRLRHALREFVHGRFTLCLSTLKEYKVDWLCDIYLKQHVETLMTLIRRKCMVEFFKPYSSITIQAMAEAFGDGTKEADVEAMTKELEGMISGKLLEARIDAVGMHLVKPHKVSERVATMKQALGVSEDQERELRLRLWRTELMREGLEVRDERKGFGQMGSGGFYDGAADGPGEVPVLGKRGKVS